MIRAKHIPLRRCVACGQRLAKRELLRIVRTPEGGVEVDSTGKKAGRGAYLCAKEECWSQGLRKGRLDHALRSPLREQDRDYLASYYHHQLEPTGTGDVR